MNPFPTGNVGDDAHIVPRAIRESPLRKPSPGARGLAALRGRTVGCRAGTPVPAAAARGLAALRGRPTGPPYGA